MTDAVETWLAALGPDERAMVNRLRGIVHAAAPRLSERIKWNAPSFADGDEDRVTLGLERKGGVRAVLHRGASVRDSSVFIFTDPDRVARWPSPDRGVAIFATLAAVEARATDVEQLVRRWVEATRTNT
jgi:hypothetical protein